MNGVERALARYASPSAAMKRTGDVDVLSLPSFDGPAAITRSFGSTDFSAS